MKRFHIFSSCLLGLIGTLIGVAALANPPARTTTVNVVDIATQMPANGAARLLRERDRLSARLVTTGLQPGAGYTIWWIVFNRPQRCQTTPCADTDLGLADGAVFFGQSVVADSAGGASASLKVKSGRLPAGTFINPSFRDRLLRGRGFRAEVHLVVVNHGIPSAGDWAMELSSPRPPEFWEQAAIFLP